MSVPATQQALALLTLHGVWSIITMDVDKPGPGELLVRVEATALNPVDWKVQSESAYYNSFVSEYPAIMGTDAAGVVAAVGEGVSNFAVGDKVLHQGSFTNRLATFKQYTISLAHITTKIPENITFDQAASLPVGVATAAIGLYAKQSASGGADLVAPWKEGGRGKYAGQPIFITGGSSSVGQYVIQFAKLSGFSPIITTISPRHNDLVQSLGVTHPIDRSLSPDDIIAAVKKITTEPLKVVYDAIASATTQSLSYDLLSPGGTLVLSLKSSIPEDKLTGDKVVIPTFGSVHQEVNKEFGKELYNNFTEYLRTGVIKVRRTL
ncbi:hypothetical protein EUX98_g2689 [Antrodiella citrinella]|uniref:Enoyl reductase (ER) domain-containing protein n=1 Tax=Antrodiella citrinella TaxID=2447956 RepID=A0A4S4N6P8_9APHY|nr:hypothetical protein EUX98_g2689 [Antrodiella citrinella]